MYRYRAMILLMLMGMAIMDVQAGAVDDLLSTYRQAGAGEFSAERGKALWHRRFPDPRHPGKIRSCTTCHGEDLSHTGKHVRTGKIIKPMAPSVNPKRFAKAKKIRKWLKRNCKWVLGRECTPQEKGDVLTFLQGQ